MKKFVEYVFAKLPGTDENFSFNQKFWVVLVTIAFSLLIFIKSFIHIIKNF